MDKATVKLIAAIAICVGSMTEQWWLAAIGFVFFVFPIGRKE